MPVNGKLLIGQQLDASSGVFETCLDGVKELGTTTRAGGHLKKNGMCGTVPQPQLVDQLSLVRIVAQVPIVQFVPKRPRQCCAPDMQDTRR